MSDFKLGQKWISNAEPELGMGCVVSVEHRLVQLEFNLVSETRTYARDKAPLSRVRFNVGEVIRTMGQIEITVDNIIERDGILIYEGKYLGTLTAIIETELDPNVTFNKPAERLFGHQFDDNRWYNLRYQTLKHRAELATRLSRGLYGPRIALIPHQLYIAQEVSTRYAPRVLLADEVGLGKTIEAGLIVHEQLALGRANRILIIVPPALSFQWFVEMIRRFTLQFTILDEERCQLIEADNHTDDENDELGLDNPFEAQQLVLCSLELFTDNPDRLLQAANAEWDLVVVDEAHHLTWDEGKPGPDYQAVERLAKAARGLLLLTATPEQLGRMGHFSRLRLLDPSRYHDYAAFVEEEAQFESIATLVDRLQVPKSSAAARKKIIDLLGGGEYDNDMEMLDALLDRHGTGRVLFRNVRESVVGFPERILHKHEIAYPAEILELPMFPAHHTSWLNSDPRVPWLVNLVSASRNKFLVICSQQETAIGLDRHLKDKTTLRSSAFHQSMDLVARDRAANYFADTEQGAQVLICSEIGSEGRNFQFAHHIIMFDLPHSPDLLEQRIGRLDRIGQTQAVNIHVPFVPGSEQADLLRVYDEGFGVFSKPNAIAQSVFNQYQQEISNQVTDQLISHIQTSSQTRLWELHNGRDRLLELNSHRETESANLIRDITELDSSFSLEAYMELSFDMFGLESEPLSEKIALVKPTEAMVRHSPISIETLDRYRYPELPDEGLSYTYDRATALSREDIHFFTWENPVVEQAMDIVLSDTSGNSCVIIVKLQGIATGTILLETLHVIECLAPARLNCDRYLPPSIVRSLITPEFKDISMNVPYREWSETINIVPEALAKIINDQEAGIKSLLNIAEQRAEDKFQPIKAAAQQLMHSRLRTEIERIKSLARVNPNVRQEEISFLEISLEELTQAITASRIRLEAIRVILAA